MTLREALLRFGVGVALTACGVKADAQGFPVFAEHIADCENKWMLSESAKSHDVRLLGYVYVDPTAGVTIEAHGEVELAPNGALVRRPDPLEAKARLIVRVESNASATCLSDDQARQLGLPREWEYRENYMDRRPLGPHYTTWAAHFNQIGAAERALEFVKLARAEGYSSADLELEHGFALNVLTRYDEAVGVLTAASRSYPRDVGITAELAYARLSTHEYQSAIELYRRALEYAGGGSETTRRWEFANNIANAYGQLGNAKSEREWREKATRWKKPAQ